MVVAEVPMWVVHSSADVAAGQNTNGGSSSAPQKQTLEEDSTQKSEKRATESLTLLEGLGGTQKCAIYSIDVHPNGQKFATGGGDGTVRLWNAGALFAQSKSKSDSGSTSKSSPHGSANYKEGGAYESSGESSGADESQISLHGGGGGGDASSGSEISMGGDEEAVRDLSSFVRRKKDGNTPKKAAVPSSSNASAPGMAPPSGKQSSAHSHHHHHHHHHRLLCTLSAHTGSSVLAVRFSTDGQYLASAGDDAVVCIYTPQLSNSSTVVTNGSLDGSVEHWTRIKLCRGHALDVVGLAWAPDDSHLVSCSLDSNAPIIVWKLTDLASNDHRPTHANVLVNPYKILGKGVHTSTVKGVTFDPAGTYLASSGDDPSICIWRAHDDWGLEKRIDAKSGIFRQWKENDSQALSSQSLFRRLSWSTDGAYICATNAVVKNKNVASTISREGWSVSNAKSTASGAANLVGHKQPVVACRHCPFLLDSRPEDAESDDEEPEYATLLALGDKRGFVTVWSTKRARPLFKIQCSETRCTVTDLAWGRVGDDVMLLVSLLDGQVVSLKFGVPDEIGKLLKPAEQARVFQLRYGIDLNDTDMGQRRLFVGENSGPKLIENALQYSMEAEDDSEEDVLSTMENGDYDDMATSRNLSSAEIKASQSESRAKGGKKRIQPLLMSVDGPAPKKPKLANGSGPNSESNARKKVDCLEGAMELAEKAASGAEAAAAAQKPSNKPRNELTGESSNTINREAAPQTLQSQQSVQLFSGTHTSAPQIPHSTDRIHAVDLPTIDCSTTTEEMVKVVADCTNSIQVPQGSRGSALPCVTVTISRSGQNTWKDQLLGCSCTAIAACKSLLAVGNADGSVQLYGTSPSLGWSSGIAFRSHPPFVWGRPIVALQLHDRTVDGLIQTEMLVVSADGTFGVYSVVPAMKIVYKGTIMPPMSHMLLASDMSTELHLPRLARIQLTETNRLLVLLSLHSTHGRSSHEENFGRNSNTPAVGAGGALQAFVYDRNVELWMRVADSRFILSDFYSTLPRLSKSKKATDGELAKLDDSVRLGATSSTLKNSRRGRAIAGSHADGAYQQFGDVGNDMATRTHCEDRIACAIALSSVVEFEYWLSMYARTLAMGGDEITLRLLVDMLTQGEKSSDLNNGDYTAPCWWLCEDRTILTMDRTKFIKDCVIPEMSKNRALQRITNEVALEVDALS